MNGPIRSALLALILPACALAQTALQGVVARPQAPKPPAPPANRTAIVDFEGDVEYGRAGGPALSRLKAAPLTLRGGDLVTTRRGGRAQVRFADGSQVELGPNSLFTMEEETPTRITLFLSVGRLWAKVAKRAERGFEVYAPTCVASVRGTQFSVEVFDQRRARVSVREGVVAVQGLVENVRLGPEVLLREGQSVRAQGALLGPLETARAGSSWGAEYELAARETGLQAGGELSASASGAVGAVGSSVTGAAGAAAGGAGSALSNTVNAVQGIVNPPKLPGLPK